MGTTRRRGFSDGRERPAAPDPAEVASFTRRLRSATRRVDALKDARDERDELIREALDAKVPWARVIESTGLSEQRIAQIRRGSRT